jgi:hypothetical protein
VALRSAAGESPGVARIVQDFQGLLEVQRNPNQVALAHARVDAAWERESFLVEMPDNRAGRAFAAEDVEEGRQCLLHLAVRIEDHAIVVVIDQSGGQAGLQLAAAGLALDPALQTRAEHVQLGLAHRSLQPQQQPVVEMARVVQAVLIEDQGSRQGADLQQAVPVAGVAGQA